MLCVAAKLRLRVEVVAGVEQAEEVEEEGETSGKAVRATEGSVVLLAVRPAICLPTRRGDLSLRGSSIVRSSTLC